MEETRTEKYRKYREEISKMEDESTFSNKEKVIRMVDDSLEKKQSASRNTTSLQIGYDELLDASDVYDDGKPEKKNTLTGKEKKDKIVRICLIALAVIFAAAAITIGILYFGGKLK